MAQRVINFVDGYTSATAPVISSGVSITETAFSFANNQSSAANVTGLLFSSSTSKSAKVSAFVRRYTDSSETIAWVTIYAAFRTTGSAWEILTNTTEGDDVGITWSITSAGQLKYVTTNQSGSSYSGASYLKAETFSP